VRNGIETHAGVLRDMRNHSDLALYEIERRARRDPVIHDYTITARIYLNTLSRWINGQHLDSHVVDYMASIYKEDMLLVGERLKYRS
jgi:hypothetical protein